MKKIYWIFLAVFLVTAVLLLVFKDYISSGILLVFTGLYFIQFLTGLTIILLTGKNAKNTGAWIYFFVALIIYIILFTRLIPS